MKRTMCRHQGFVRRFRALGMASLAVTASYCWIGVTPAKAITVDSGVLKSPASLPTTVATMPQLGSGSNITWGGISQNNIGTFDIVIVPSPALSANPGALAAFNRAALLWESVIADPITVTINADFSPLGAGILGSTGSTYLQASYNTIRNAMVTDAANETDDGIVASLPTAAQYTVTVPSGFGLDGNIVATKANLKALGFAGLDAMFGVPDADIAFSTLFGFDTDNSNGITAGQFDFEGVAAHEIGHALGFVSAVDDFDFVLPGTATDMAPYPLDLFRFRDGSVNDPTTPAQFTTFARDMVPGSVDIFDQINAGFGGSVEVLMSTGVDFGDGNQASHWKDNSTLGIMDPTASPGELLVLRPNDIRAMDLIGYEIQVVPEASTFSLLVMGGVMTFVGCRRW